MTCRRPTISVRMEVLQRLARANSEPDAPDSLEFTPTSWRELERNSLTEGLDELLADQEARAREAEECRALLLRQQESERALHRARQRAEARRWEEETIERQRVELVERRIENARRLAAEEIQGELEEKRARFSAELKVRSHENAWAQEVAKTEVTYSHKRWARASQALLAAAALCGVVWVSAFGQARSVASDELSQSWAESQANELSAETRVAELEAEIDRRVNLTESEREWLEKELLLARASLHESKKETEEIDRRRPVERPSKMAQNLLPTTDTLPKKPAQAISKDGSALSSVRVATDEVIDSGCSEYDPLCFDL